MRKSTRNGVVRVTFELPAAVEAERVAVCGDFNDWCEESSPLTRRKDGRFTVTLSLEPDRRYRFRYLLDGTRWENDWAADAYVANDYGTEDSVVET